MQILDETLFGLGYYDPDLNGIKEVTSDIKVILMPFETKTLKFYVYGSKVDKNSLISVVSSVDSLVSSNKVSLTMSGDKPRNQWLESDVLYTEEGVDIYPLYITLCNIYYSELNTQLKIDLSLHSKLDPSVNNISYYGELVDSNGYKVLSRPIENKSERTLIIDPTPDGSDYNYLSYSSGDSLILLDNDTGIPYKPEEAITLTSASAMSMPDAGFYVWDDGEIIDWDTDVNTSTSTTDTIADDAGTALTSDENTGYSFEDNLIDKGE